MVVARKDATPGPGRIQRSRSNWRRSMAGPSASRSCIATRSAESRSAQESLGIVVRRSGRLARLESRVDPMNWLVALGLALIAWPASGGIDEGPSAPLQPRSFSSASGNWELRVDPTSRFGEGPGDHELWHDGALVWKERHPFTFYDAVIAEDGTVAGYAYTNGWRDPTCEGNFVVSTVGV